MQAILGKLNGTFLVNTLTLSYPASKSIRMAVAYADFHDPVVEHIRKHSEVKLQFYGRMDHTGAVSLQLLDWFLNKSPATVQCFLVNGRYHPKVIWWDGFGAYIGSANLTSNGWERNIEAGMFLTEEELEERGVAEDLDVLFDHLDDISLRLTPDLYTKLEQVEQARRRIQGQLDSVKAKYDELLGGEKPYAGQTTVFRRSDAPSKARQQFVDEWRETLVLMRKLCREFNAIGGWPAWVPDTANPTVHFDQFLHGYYYHYIEATAGPGKAADKVAEIHKVNARDPAKAFGEAVAWWASLKGPPTTGSYNEELFITQRAPRMKELLSKHRLASLDLDSFTEAMGHSHAFREHARHLDRPGSMAATEQEPENEKLRRLCSVIWSERTAQGRDVLDVLGFLIYGTKPAEAEHRLWLAIRNKEWRLPHLGRSTLGELIGWARPDDYPPRNNRNNLALKALGYDVTEF